MSANGNEAGSALCPPRPGTAKSRTNYTLSRSGGSLGNVPGQWIEEKKLSVVSSRFPVSTNTQLDAAIKARYLTAVGKAASKTVTGIRIDGEFESVSQRPDR